MISESSPIESLPFELVDRRQVIFLEGIEQTVKLMELNYSLIEEACAGQGSPGRDRKAELVGAAWEFVDCAQRLRSLISKMPGLAQNAAVHSIVRDLAAAEELRHALQHLDSKVAEIAAGNHPSWGSLSWLEPLSETQISSRAMVPGAIFAGTSIPIVNPVGKTIRSPMDHLHLNALGSSVNLSELRRSTQRFVHRLENALDSLLPLDGDEPEVLRIALSVD